MGTRKEGFKKLTVAGKYRGYGIVGSYFGWTFEYRKHNVFCCSVNLLSTLLVKQPSEAHVPLFRSLSFVRISLQAGSLDPHKQRHVLTKGLCGTRLADSANTELLWISLMKPGASTLLSKLR